MFFIKDSKMSRTIAKNSKHETREAFGMKQWVKTAIALGLTWLGMFFLEYVFVVEGVAVTNNILLIPLAVAYFIVIRKSLEEDTAYYKFAMPLGMFFSFALVLGTQLMQYQGIFFKSKRVWGACITYTFIMGIWIARAYQWLDTRNRKAPFALPGWCDKILRWRFFYVFCVGVILLAWLPVWLASYPGFFCIDVGSQYSAYVAGTVTKAHPVMHTYLLGSILSFSEKLTGSANPGIAVLTWIQMIFLANVFAYTLQYMRKIKMPDVVVLLGLLLYGFLPTIQVYAGCTTKDLIYTGFFTLLIVKIIQLLKEEDAYWQPFYRKAGFGVTLFFMLAFRNNALYIVLVFLMLGLVIVKKRKKLLYLVSGITVAVFLIYNGPFMKWAGIGEGEAREMLSIPLQQLGRVYIYNGQSWSDEERRLLFEVVPKETWDCYQPKTADAIKITFYSDVFEKNKEELAKIWLNQGLKNPGLYAEAFLLNTVDSWCPNSILDGHVGYFYTRDLVQSSYFIPQIDAPGVQEGKWPWLYGKIVDFGYRISFQRIPLYSMLFSVGAMFWFVLFTWVYTLYKKKYSFSIAYVLILLSFLTHLLGPMVLVRYHLILFFTFPLSIGMICQKDEIENG